MSLFLLMQDIDARQRLAFHPFQECTAGGRDIGEIVRDARVIQGCDGIAAAYEAIESGDMACTIANNGYLLMGYGAAYAYEVATGALPKIEKPVIKTQAVLVNGDNVKEYKAMFIDGMPKYDFTDLKFCVLSDYASFADLAAATAK